MQAVTNLLFVLISVLDFFGRFHPVLVHLPIGILLIGILLQWLSASPKYEVSFNVIRIVLLTGTFSAILSCITGYLLSLDGDYDTDMVAWHMWMGFGVAVASLLYLQRIVTRKDGSGTKLTSISLLILILMTGHMGGSLTHGSDYLISALKASPVTDVVQKPIANVQEAVVYKDVIQPLLQAKCNNCHNAQKQKGGLRMDEYRLLMKGGKNGEVVYPGNADESEMIKRLLLPVGDEHHMPPRQKPQVNDREVSLLHWWISSGADTGKKVKELPQPDAVKPALLALQSNRTQPKTPATVPSASVEKADEKAVSLLRDLGAVVVPVARESNYLMVNFVTVPRLTTENIKLLLPLKKQVVWLKLNDASFPEQALSIVGDCPNITMLHLNNTNVTDKGLAHLTKLSNLQLLSLVGTNVTAQGIQQLAGLKKLGSVYLYGTKVTASDTVVLRRQFAKTIIDIGGYTIPSLASDTARVSAKNGN